MNSVLRLRSVVCLLLISVACLMAGLPSHVIAQDWPQFRGPHRDGKSDETNLLTEWPDEGPELEWTANDVGTGYSSIAVVGDRMYTIGDIDNEQFVIALNSNTGEHLWRKAIGNSHTESYGGSRSTPTFDNGSLFCLSTDGVLVCLDAENGDLKWDCDLVKDFQSQMMLAMGTMNWKYSESPLVDGDQVVVTPGTREAAMVAFDRETGKEIWRCAIPNLGEKGRDGAGYSSMVIGHGGGTRQYVQLIGKGMIGVDAKTGKFLWGYNGIANDVANISSPAVIGDQVFASTGYQTGSALVQLETSGEGNLMATEEYFLNQQVFQNHHGHFIVQDGYVYGGHGHKMGLPICIRLADGEVMWGPIRNNGKASAACCFADGHLYFRYQDGLMVLVEATPDAYREKGSFMIPDVRAESWSHPVIANGRLYLKEQDRILCYSIAGAD